jgi:hypothetical protein
MTKQGGTFVPPQSANKRCASSFLRGIGLQTLLLSCRAVFTVEDVTAFEHCESVLHSCLSFYGHELKTVPAMCRQLDGIVGNSEKLFPQAAFTDTFTDS